MAEIERSLAAGIEPVYVVLGTVGPLVERARNAIEAAILPSIGIPAFNHSRYRCTEPDAASAFIAARTLPMMSERRLIELRDLDSAQNDLFEALVAYLAEPCPSAVLLVTGSGFPKVEKGGANWGARVRAAMKKSRGLLVSFGADAIKPVPFAIEVAAAAGKQLQRADAEMLVEIVGADPGRIEQEVNKLAIFVGEAPAIDADAIAAAGSMVAEAVIWDLTTGLATRDAELALAALYRLQSSGEDPRKLLGMIAWQMRDLLKVSELVAEGVPDKEIANRVRAWWNLMRKVRPMMTPPRRFFDAAELLRRLATANRQMNSHRAGAERILEGLVLEMLEGELRRPELRTR